MRISDWSSDVCSSDLIHIGDERIAAGRVGEAPAVGLSATLARAGFALGRLKTGTPPRLDGRTIAYGGLVEQAGDEPPEPFSALTRAIAQPPLCCHITQTTPASHALIQENLHRAPTAAERHPGGKEAYSKEK